MMRVLTEQTDLPLGGAVRSAEAARRAYASRLLDAGIRPPERWEETPGDLAPPVRRVRGLRTLLRRVRRRLKR